MTGEKAVAVERLQHPRADAALPIDVGIAAARLGLGGDDFVGQLVDHRTRLAGRQGSDVFRSDGVLAGRRLRRGCLARELVIGPIAAGREHGKHGERSGPGGDAPVASAAAPLTQRQVRTPLLFSMRENAASKACSRWLRNSHLKAVFMSPMFTHVDTCSLLRDKAAPNCSRKHRSTRAFDPWYPQNARLWSRIASIVPLSDSSGSCQS